MMENDGMNALRSNCDRDFAVYGFSDESRTKVEERSPRRHQHGPSSDIRPTEFNISVEKSTFWRVQPIFFQL